MFLSNLKKYSYPSVVFLSSFLAYVFTMPRTIYLGDNAEYITAAVTLGIPHPSGYPLYVILSKLFSLFPISTLAFRVNLLSAVAASFGLVIFYLIFLKACEYYQLSNPGFNFPPSAQKLLALSVSLLLAFTSWFWYEATTAQVYTLNFLFFVLLFWLVLKFWENPHTKYLLWGSLLAGLGLANHQMLVLLLPFFFAAVAPSGYKSEFSVKLWMLGLFLLGLSVYLYLPIRSHMQPLYQWGDVGASWGAFFNHILRSDYADLGLSAGWSDKAKYAYDFFAAAARQFGLVVLWSLFGIVALYRSEKRLLLLSLGLVIGNVGGIILLRDISYSAVGGEIFTKYCLTSFAVVALLIGLGAVEIFRLFATYLKGLARAPYVIGVIILALTFAVAPITFAANDLHDFNFLQDYSKKMLESMPPNSVLAVSLEGASTDSVIFSLLYQQKVQNLRPDVALVGLPQVYANADFSELNTIMRTGSITEQRANLVDFILSHARYANKPIYSTFLTESLKPDNPWASYSNGFVYFLANPGDANPNSLAEENILSEADRLLLEQNVYGQDLLAQYYYAQASQLIQNGNFKDSQDFYVKAIATEDNPLGPDIFAYRAHRDAFLKP